MTSSETTPRHPIRVVAQRTGLTPATIRAWERRYGAVKPGRSDGGQRLYSDHDVDRLARLRELTDVGRPISMVAGLSDQAVTELLREDRAIASERARAPEATEPSSLVERSYHCVEAMNQDELERVLWRGAMTLDGATFLDDVVAPLLTRVGEGWESGELNPGQEHMGSDVVDRILTRMTEPSRPAEGASLVVATLPGERHRLGARLVSAAATVDGWKVTYLGDDLPVVDIVSAAERVSAVAVAISVVRKEEIERTTRDLSELRELLDSSIDVLVGGRGAQLLDRHDLPAGISIFEGLEGLRKQHRGG